MARIKVNDVQTGGAAEALGAAVYQDGSAFICLLPVDHDEIVIVHGETVVEAINNWDEKLKAHLRHAKDDAIVKHINDTMTTSLKQPQPVPSVIKGKTKVDIAKTTAHFLVQYFPTNKR